MEEKENKDKAVEKSVTEGGKKGLLEIAEVRILLYMLPVVTVVLILALILGR